MNSGGGQQDLAHVSWPRFPACAWVWRGLVVYPLAVTWYSTAPCIRSSGLRYISCGWVGRGGGGGGGVGVSLGSSPSLQSGGRGVGCLGAVR